MSNTAPAAPAAPENNTRLDLEVVKETAELIILTLHELRAALNDRDIDEAFAATMVLTDHALRINYFTKFLQNDLSSDSPTSVDADAN